MAPGSPPSERSQCEHTSVRVEECKLLRQRRAVMLNRPHLIFRQPPARLLTMTVRNISTHAHTRPHASS